MQCAVYSSTNAVSSLSSSFLLIACLFVCSTSVVSMLEEFRRLACSFAVPLMVVNGAKLLELAHSYGVETKPTPQVHECNA